MPYQVSRTDTGQFVLMDSATDTVVIDDDLAAGFDKLEQAVADKPLPIVTAPTPVSGTADSATQGSSAFSFRGGPRYTPTLLAVVLPFAWLAVLYFALANLLSETALDRGANGETEAKVEALEREIQTLRSEIAGAPRTGKTTPKRSPKRPAAKPAPIKPATAPVDSDADDDDDESAPDEPTNKPTNKPENKGPR